MSSWTSEDIVPSLESKEAITIHRRATSVCLLIQPFHGPVDCVRVGVGVVVVCYVRADSYVLSLEVVHSKLRLEVNSIFEERSCAEQGSFVLLINVLFGTRRRVACGTRPASNIQ